MGVQHPGAAAAAGRRLPGVAGERLLRVPPDQPGRGRALRPRTGPSWIDEIPTSTADKGADWCTFSSDLAPLRGNITVSTEAARADPNQREGNHDHEAHHPP
jgi:hypothetical protein